MWEIGTKAEQVKNFGVFWAKFLQMTLKKKTNGFSMAFDE